MMPYSRKDWPCVSIRRDAAIFPVLEDKPTLRGQRECVEFDPEETLGPPRAIHGASSKSA
jgi:hypothetical protein